jgi:hypothetical protein
MPSSTNYYNNQNRGISPPRNAAEMPRPGDNSKDYRSVSPLPNSDDHRSVSPEAEQKQKREKEEDLGMRANFANLNDSPGGWMLPPRNM